MVSGEGRIMDPVLQSFVRATSQTRSAPDYYYGQLQHILAVTGLDSLDFWCYWPGSGGGFVERLAHGQEHATLDGGADAAVHLQPIGRLRRHQ